MNIKAKVMTKHVGDGSRYDQTVIDEIVKDQPDVPIRFNFSGSPIGKVNKYYRDESGHLIIEGTLFVHVSEEISSMYVVPGGIAKFDDVETIDGVDVIKKMTLRELSITPCPTDISLSILKEIK